MGFDPVTLTLGMMAGGSLLKAGGDIFTGINKSNMDKYQAGWAQKQAVMEQQNAAYARSVGEVKAQRVGEAAAQDYGKAVATEASSGFKVGSGTYGDVNAAIRRRGQFDEATTRQNAAREAYGYEVKSAEDTVKAGMYKTAAKTDMISGFIGGASSILGGGTQVADKWVQFGQAGLIV